MMAVFSWVQTTSLARLIQETAWLFPVIEALHLCAIALLIGCEFITNLYLLGWGLDQQSATEIQRQCQRGMLVSLAAVAGTGILLFISEALKLYYSPFYWLKMAALAAALTFTFKVRNPIARARRGKTSSQQAAVVSSGLWILVAVFGRWIGWS
jgi:hypothetical protein